MNKWMYVALLATMGMGQAALAQEASPEEAFVIRKTVIAWLECEECSEKQLEAVQKLGERAVPTLGAALERGPSPANLEKLQLHLEKNYRELVEYSRTHDEVKVDLSEEEYVKLYLENYRANYGVRAAQALGKLGGEGARKHLEAASKLRLRADVRAAVEQNARRLSR